MLETLSLRLATTAGVELPLLAPSVDLRCFFSLFTDTGLDLNVLSSGISGGVGDVEVDTEHTETTATSFFFFGDIDASLPLLLVEVPVLLVSVEDDDDDEVDGLTSCTADPAPVAPLLVNSSVEVEVDAVDFNLF